jgi:hypothetical protein
MKDCKMVRSTYGEMRNAFKILQLENLKRRDHLEDVGTSRRIILKLVFEDIKGVPGGKVNVLGGHSILSKKVHMYTCPILNGF